MQTPLISNGNASVRMFYCETHSRYVHTYGWSFVYHSLAAAVGASLGVLGGLNGLIVAIAVFCLLLMW